MSYTRCRVLFTILGVVGAAVTIPIAGTDTEAGTDAKAGTDAEAGMTVDEVAGGGLVVLHRES